MTKRTPPEIQQKIIAANNTNKYTHLQIGQKYGVSRQCVWAIVNRDKKNSHHKPSITPSKSDMIKILNKVNLGDIELEDIWASMRRCLKKKFSGIQINGQVYRL